MGSATMKVYLPEVPPRKRVMVFIRYPANLNNAAPRTLDCRLSWLQGLCK
jgi:hypothetical protein